MSWSKQDLHHRFCEALKPYEFKCFGSIMVFRSECTVFIELYKFRFEDCWNISAWFSLDKITEPKSWDYASQSDFVLDVRDFIDQGLWRETFDPTVQKTAEEHSIATRDVSKIFVDAIRPLFNRAACVELLQSEDVRQEYFAIVSKIGYERAKQEVR